MEISKYCTVLTLVSLLAVPAGCGCVSADPPVEGKFRAEISYSGSRGFRILLHSRRGPDPGLPMSSATVEGEMSPQGNRTFEFEGTLEGELSESGLDLLSEREVLGRSMLDLISLADGSPTLVETAVLDGWEGRAIHEIPLAKRTIESFLPYPSDNLPRLRIESIDLSKFSWDNGSVRVGFSLKLSKKGDRPLYSERVGVEGSLESEGDRTVKEATFAFSPPPAGWGFEVPYLCTIYGNDRSDLEEKLKGAEAEVVMDTAGGVVADDIPGGYRTENSAYLWTGDDGAGALASLVTAGDNYSVAAPKREEKGEPHSDPEGLLPIAAAAAGLIVASGLIVWYITGRKS